MKIRTIVVTTRAAVRSNTELGRPDVAVQSAHRGVALLEELRDRLSPEADDHVREWFEAAQRELTKLAGESGMTGFTIEEPAGGTPASLGGEGSTSEPG